MKKIILSVFVSLGIFGWQSVSAHVVVKPAQVGVGAFQTFTVGVPNEKTSGVYMLRLIVPEGLEYVTPNVKPGWKIYVKKNGTGENAKVEEITWYTGFIPAGERDDFIFSAKVPTATTTLIWKAYQSYADGTVVAWDIASSDQPKDEKGESDFSKSGPYSETSVVDDLSGTVKNTNSHDPLVLTLSIIALLVSAGALGLTLKK